jgi:hypothetical protein
MQQAADYSEATPRPAPPWPWRGASWLATLAAIGLFAAVLAYWGWRAFGPVATPLPPAETPERWSEAITAYPVFGRAAPAAAAVDGQPAAQTLGPDARLLGVFAEADGRGYALFRLAERGPVVVAAGAEIARGVTLEAVRPDGVRIRDHGERREIALRAAPIAVPTPAPAHARVASARAACAMPAGYKGPVYRLNAELLTGIASQPDSWKSLLVPAPGGLAVRDENGFATMLGLKSGDRVTVANGIALNGVDDVLAAVVGPLVASQPVRVSGTRGGKPAEWLFVNAGACPG